MKVWRNFPAPIGSVPSNKPARLAQSCGTSDLRPALDPTATDVSSLNGEVWIMRRNPPPGHDLMLRIETGIQARTHGQVRGLRVELEDDHVILSGHARTYYAKQLAQHGAMDVVEDRAIVNQIEVC